MNNFLSNIRRFLNFVIGLYFTDYKNSISKYKFDNIIVTPLRGAENCWVDYYIAIKYSKIISCSVVLMRPNLIPFGVYERSGKIKWYINLLLSFVKFYLIIFLLKIKGVKYYLINADESEKVDISNNVTLGVEEFLRRYYGCRDYGKFENSDLIKNNITHVFNNLEKTIINLKSKSSVLVTSHAIYEWSIAYNIFNDNNLRCMVWGANIYNSQILKVSNKPLQIGIPKGRIYKDKEIDFTKRIEGTAIDQPMKWSGSSEPSVTEFLSRYNRIVTLAPNCVWDGDTNVRDSFFSGIYDWITKTIDFAILNPSIGFIIRIHPAEGNMWAFRPSLWKMLNSSIIKQNNILVIPPDMQISTLELAKKSNIFVFYSGIVGLEANLLGINVCCVSNSIFGKVKGVRVVNSLDEYHYALLHEYYDNNEGIIESADVFNKGVCIENHPGSEETMFTNPYIKGFYVQPELESFFEQHVLE
jgi:hypothetical protein